ncbi:MAG TPA: hypothetical protein VMM92_06500, partial [Thermoanaerobaculia bacterium]|nr:hypothetical protein [Thermoanaerobaculia bacterium]
MTQAMFDATAPEPSAPATAVAVAESPAPAAVGSPAAWSLGQRLGFRFFFSYFLLYLFPFPLDYIPYPVKPLELYQRGLNGLVLWVGRVLFGQTITVFPNGSGDTTYNYVQLFCYLTIACVATAVWSVLDRKRLAYPRLQQWFRLYLRFALATAMLSYGAIKVIKSQFPNPSLGRLIQPFGDASPMGLLWTFMGASKAYTNFSGACEMLGGFLLTARRTTLLGALVCFGVITNIVLLNFCYDVPVKLYSSHLLLISAVLIAPDARRLINLLILNRPAGPSPIGPLFNRRFL